MGQERKEWRETKILKSGGKLGQGVGVLKRGLEPPYKLWPNIQLIQKQPSVDIMQKRCSYFLVNVRNIFLQKSC